MSSAGIKVLAFALGEEEYAMDIKQVQVIRGYSAVTTMATAPAYTKGVINLRAIIVPLVDMRIRFNLGTLLMTHQRSSLSLASATRSSALSSTAFLTLPS